MKTNSATSQDTQESLKQQARQRAGKEPLREKIKKVIKGRSKATYREIIINVDALETRIAVLADGILESLQVEQVSQKRRVGSIFKGRVQNLESGLQAAFIDIGQEKNAFLHYWDIVPGIQRDQGVEIIHHNRGDEIIRRPKAKDVPKEFPLGSEIIVQITKDQISSKGPRITTNLALPGRFLVLTPLTADCGVSRKIEGSRERARLRKILQKLPIPKGIGLIIRTVGEKQGLKAFERDLDNLLKQWKTIEEKINKAHAPFMVHEEPDILERTIRDFLTENIDRVLVDQQQAYESVLKLTEKIHPEAKGKITAFNENIPIFERFNIERQAQRAFGRHVPLPSGGELVIDETEALVAIDVNTGSHKHIKDSKDYLLQVNLEAAKEASHQIKLRNIGGLIIIDFVDMKAQRARRQVYECIKESMDKDKAKTQILPISTLGILQMTRQRQEESYTKGIYKQCPCCGGAGTIKSPRTMSTEIQRQIASCLSRLNHSERNAALILEITLHPDNLERLSTEDRECLLKLEKDRGVQLSFISDPKIHSEKFHIEDKTHHKKLF